MPIVHQDTAIIKRLYDVYENSSATIRAYAVLVDIPSGETIQEQAVERDITAIATDKQREIGLTVSYADSDTALKITFQLQETYTAKVQVNRFQFYEVTAGGDLIFLSALSLDETIDAQTVVYNTSFDLTVTRSIGT